MSQYLQVDHNNIGSSYQSYRITLLILNDGNCWLIMRMNVKKINNWRLSEGFKVGQKSVFGHHWSYFQVYFSYTAVNPYQSK